MSVGIIASAHVESAGPTSPFVNRSTYDGPRMGAGVFTHTVTFTAATAGNVLLAVVYGSVTSFGAGGAGTPPTGWEHASNVVANGGLYAFIKTAAGGESSFTITHNGANYPIKAVVYEFPPRTTWCGAATGSYAPAVGNSNPVTTVPGDGMWAFALSGQNLGATSGSASATYPAGTTEDLDTFTSGQAGSDGCWLGVGYIEDYTGTAYFPTRTMTTTSTANCEAINAALQQPATPTWLNHVAVAAPRNGATTHTVDPSSGTVVAGTAFTPTAGRLLVVAVEGPVTSTTPAGWTLPSGGSAISGTGAYVWHRVAAGADTLTTTHNGSDRPVFFHFFEFSAGSTFVSAAAAAAATPPNTVANPNLTGLTGTNTVMALKGTSVAGTAGSGSVAGAWGAGTSEASDYIEMAAATSGYWCSVGYRPNHTATSYQPTCVYTTSGTPGVNASVETITWAINVV